MKKIKWLTLLKATGLVFGLFAVIGVTIVLGSKCPLLLIGAGVVTLIAIIYHWMSESEDNYTDNDRMSWFSNYEDEEEKEEEQ